MALGPFPALIAVSVVTDSRVKRIRKAGPRGPTQTVKALVALGSRGGHGTRGGLAVSDCRSGQLLRAKKQALPSGPASQPSSVPERQLSHSGKDTNLLPRI